VARWPQRYREINHNTCYRCYFLDFEQHIAPGMEAIYDDMPMRPVFAQFAPLVAWTQFYVSAVSWTKLCLRPGLFRVASKFLFRRCNGADSSFDLPSPSAEALPAER
jgi:hypothetical protein